jgi:hypothetical protein
MSDEKRAALAEQKHQAYVRRKARDLEAFRLRAATTMRRLYAKDPAKFRATSRRAYAADPERYIAYQKAYAERNPELMKDKHYRRYYGIGLDDYNAMFEAQDGLCAICGLPETARIKGRLKALSVDHDHKTGAVRQLLCHRCNRAIGWFGEDPILIDAAAAYVRRHRG